MRANKALRSVSIMIIDDLSAANKYINIHPLFKQAFAFVQNTQLCTLSEQRYAILGESLYATIATNTPRQAAESFLEAHRRYIDLQFVIAGSEQIGWRHLSECSSLRTPYDSERDIVFFDDKPKHWLTLTAGTFTIFFPHDAHAPGVSTEPVKKVVVKIAAE